MDTLPPDPAQPASPVPPPIIPPPLEPQPLQPAPAPRVGPWGFWPSLGFGFATFFAGQVIPGIVVVILLMTIGGHKSVHQLKPEEIASNGLFLAVSTLLSLPLTLGLVFLFAWLRRTLPLREYLGLRWPGIKAALLWTLGLIGLLAVMDTLTVFSGKTIVPEFMVKVYQSAGFVPLLWLALIVAAPLGEEFLFRGFLLEGFRHSRLGAFGAVLLTSVLWAALHMQYDIFGIAMILAAGIFLGYCRLKTGSLWLCIWLHAFMNLVATIELLIYLSRTRG